MTIFGLAWFGLGCVSGFGFGLTKRRKPSPPPEDVGEETMQRFERIMQASAAYDTGRRFTADIMH